MTLPKAKKRRTQAERRQRSLGAILDVATDILAREGYGRFSSSRVAGEAGLSRGALEHYFPKRLDQVAGQGIRGRAGGSASGRKAAD